jgi:triacylglycerol lipase
VVLAHGVLGFDTLSVGGVKHEYFRGLASHLKELGTNVYAVRLPPLSSIAARGEALAQAVRALPHKRVNIIAHSMGGLDSRYAITTLELARHVASLTTIGTPHRGTPIADLGTGLLGDKLGLARMCRALALDVDAFYDLTTKKMAQFNERVPDVRGVTYGSYVAVCHGKVNPLLLPGFLYLKASAGENDGLVPATSQEWGEVLGRIEADHWAQIGWSRHFDATDFYAELVRELAARGF